MSAPYDIVLLPNADIAERSVRLSHDLVGENTYFELDSAEHFPHVSLYMVQLEQARVAEVSAYLAGLAAQTAPLELTTEGYKRSSSGYFGVTYARTAALAGLQAEIIANVNPLRDGLTPLEAALQPTATGQCKTNIDTYGYKNVGELLSPHLTLTRFVRAEAGVDPDDASLPAIDNFSGLFPELGLFEVGEHGTCVREIARYALLAEQL